MHKSQMLSFWILPALFLHKPFYVNNVVYICRLVIHLASKAQVVRCDYAISRYEYNCSCWKSDFGICLGLFTSSPAFAACSSDYLHIVALFSLTRTFSYTSSVLGSNRKNSASVSITWREQNINPL